MTTYTKDDLRKIYNGLQRTLPPGSKPLTVAEIAEVNALLEKTRAMIATAATAVERGRRVLEWRIPREQAPTMNEWGYWDSWQKSRNRKELDDALRRLIAASPGADLLGEHRMRWVRVTRFTLQTKRVDDAAIDAIGGKMPVDALVRCRVLAGDTPNLLKREACVAKTTKGNTHLLVEVFEVAAEAVPCGPPQDAPCPPLVRKRGKMTRTITGEAGT